MNAPEATLDAALLARARAQSRQSRRSLVEELQGLSGLEPREIVRLLAEPFGLATMETPEMFGQQPAFDLLPLAQALARHCVLLRDDAKHLTGVIADPFDLDLQTWLQAHAGATASRRNPRAPSTRSSATAGRGAATARARRCCRSRPCRKPRAPPSSS